MSEQTMDRVGKALATAILTFGFLAAMSPKAHAQNFTIQLSHASLNVPAATALKSLERREPARDEALEAHRSGPSASTFVEVVEGWLGRVKPTAASAGDVM